MTQFSDFIRNTKGKEREKVMLEVAEEAIKDQKEIMTTTNKENEGEKKHVCCDGECNHDDCCGKIPENCPNFSSPTEHKQENTEGWEKEMESALDEYHDSLKPHKSKYMIKDILKEIEEAFDKKFIKTAEHSYKSAVSDQIAAYRHQLENLLEARLFLKSSIIKVLQQLVEREEKNIADLTNDAWNEWEQGMYQVYKQNISYLKSEIANLSTNIDKE